MLQRIMRFCGRARQYRVVMVKQPWRVWLLIICLGLFIWSSIIDDNEQPVPEVQKTSVSVTPNATPVKPFVRSGGRPVVSTQAQEAFTEYTVARRDYIITIAEDHGVPWQSVVLANDTELAERATERCSKLSPAYRRNPHRRGHYCN